MPKEKIPCVGSARQIQDRQIVRSPNDPETANEETMQRREVKTHGRVGR